MITKKNDWFSTILHQPEMSIADMYNNGVTPDNTEFKTRDFYKNLPKVVEAFTNNEGQFDDSLFNNKYQSALMMYNEFANSDFENVAFSNYDYASEEWYAPLGNPVKDLRARLTINTGPDKRSHGISGLGRIGGTNMSMREIGQTNKVWDPENDEWLDWTPNDKGGLFKAITRPTLVLAAWDEDGEHEYNGQKVRHYEGDLKLNAFGEPFYELLGKREMYNKDVLHYTDTLTVDGSKWNKYDFFDSDGLDKSVGGTVMKTVFTVAPMLIPKVGRWFGAISAASALSQVLPTVAKSINGIVSGTNDNDVGKFFTTIENATSRFGSSVSDYSREHLVSLENLGKLVEDVSLQLFQQRVIGEIPRMFQSGKVTASNIKLGQNLALAYMATTSSQEVYGEFKEAGASDRVAGLGMLASIGAMYKLMTIDYFRDSLFKGTYLDESVVKTPAKEVIDEIKGSLGIIESNPRRGLAFLSKRFSDKVTAAAAKSVSNSKSGLGKALLHKSLNEGIEEVMEELSADTVKALFEGLEALGVPMNKDRVPLDFNWDATDIFQRYGMSFVGGAIGGPIFELQTRWESHLNNTITNHNRQGTEELVYLVAQGRADEIRNHYTYLHSKNKLGNPNLSSNKVEIVGTVDGGEDIAFLGASDSDSQNDTVYGVLMNHIDYLERLMSEEGLLLSKARLEEGLLKQLNAKQPDFADVYTQVVAKAGLHNRLLADFQSISTDIIQKRSELEALVSKDQVRASTEPERKAHAQSLAGNLEIQRLQSELNELRAKRDAIINGERNDYYLGQSLFTFNDAVRNQFIDLSLESFALLNYSVNYTQADEVQKAKIKEEYEDYLKEKGQNTAFRAFDVYYAASEKFAPKLIEENSRLENLSRNEIYTQPLPGFQYITALNTLGELERQINIIRDKKDRSVEDNDKLSRLYVTRDSVRKAADDIARDPSLALVEMGDENVPTRVSLNTETPDVVLADNVAKQVEAQLQYMAENKIVAKNNDEIDMLYDVIKRAHTTDTNYLDTKFNEVLEPIVGDDPNNIEAIFEPLYADRSELYELVDDFKNAVGSDTDEANGILAKMVELINRSTDGNLTDSQVQELIEALIPQINGESIITFMDRINGLRNQITQSGYSELLSELITAINGEPIKIEELIKEQRYKLSNQRDLRDYVIENPVVENDLQKAQEINHIAQALIWGAADGMNASINSLRGMKAPLAEISEGTLNIFRSDAELIRQQLSTLLTLSEGNKQKRLRAHIDVAINMKPKFARTLLGEGNIVSDAVNDIISKYTSKQITLQELWDQAGELSINDNIDDNNFADFEVQMANFEESVYKLLSPALTNAANRSDIAKALADVFGNDIWKMKSTILSEDSKETVQMYDLFLYTAAIMGTSSGTFYSNLLDVISDENYAYAPVYSQELAIRSAWAFSLQNPFFSDILTEIYNKRPQVDPSELQGKTEDIAAKTFEINGTTYNGDDLIYFNNKSLLDKVYFIFGGAGTGKTTAIARTLKLMLEKSDATFITMAPGEAQVRSLSESLGLDPNLGRTKEQFFDIIRGTKESNPNFVDWSIATAEQNQHKQQLVNASLSNNDPFIGNSQFKFLFVDEASLFTEAEYQLLNTWASQNNVVIIALGDLKQNSVKFADGQTSGINDTFHTKSPSLTAALRANNNGKIDNYVILRNIVERAEAQLFEDPAIVAREMAAFTNAMLASGIQLRYAEGYADTEKTKWEIRGEKIVSTTNDAFWINLEQLKQRGSVLIVTDNEEKYSKVKDGANADENVEIRNSRDAQGGEFDFVIIDKNWNAENNGNSYYMVKDLYTLTQRSRVGSLIVDNGIKKVLNISNPSNSGAWHEFKLPAQEIETFKNIRKEILGRVQRPADDAMNLSPVEKVTPTISVEADAKPVEPTPVNTEVARTETESRVEEAPSNPTVNSIDSNQGEKAEIHDSTLPASDPEVQTTEEILVSQDQADTITDVDAQPSGVQTSSAELVVTTKKNNRLTNQEQIRRIVEEAANEGRNVLPINHDDYTKWMYADNNLWVYDRESSNSLYNFIKNKDKIIAQDYIEFSRLISDAVLNGHDLNNGKQRLFLLMEQFPEIRDQFLPAINQGYEVHLVQSQRPDKTDIIARFNVNGTPIDILIGFLNGGDFGQYTGEFNFVRGVTYQTGDRHSVSDLETNPQFTVAPQWLVVSITQEELQEKIKNGTFSPEMGDWISRNNGKLFIYVTDDSWADFASFITKTEETVTYTDDLGKEVTTDQFTYLTQKSGKFTTMGVQKNVDFSDLIIYSIATTQPDIVDTQYRRKNYHAMAQTGLYTGDGQDFGVLKNEALRISGLGSYEDAKKKDIIPADRAGKLLTGLLNAAQQVPSAFKIVRQGLFQELKVAEEMPWTDSSGKKFKFKTLLEVASPTTGNSYLFNYVKRGNEYFWSVSKFDGYNKRILDEDIQLLSLKDTSVPINDLITWVRTAENLPQDNLYNPRDIQLRLISRKGTATENPSYVYYTTYTRNMIYALTNKLPDYKMLDSVLRNDTYFKNEIFINDVAGAALSENTILRTLATNKAGYTIDAVNVEGSIYTIDGTQIIKGTTQKRAEKSQALKNFERKMENLRTVLSENDLSYEIPAISYRKNLDMDIEFEFLIRDINQYFKGITLDPNIPVLSINEDGIVTVQKVVNNEQFIENMLIDNDVEFRFFDESNFENSNFLTTFVTLGDGSRVGYSIAKDKGEWTLSRFNSLTAYQEVMNALNNLTDTGLNQESRSKVENYINSIQSDNSSMTLARDYVAVITDNAEVLGDFNTLVNNYLLERLKNNEC